MIIDPLLKKCHRQVDFSKSWPRLCFYFFFFFFFFGGGGVARGRGPWGSLMVTLIRALKPQQQ